MTLSSAINLERIAKGLSSACLIAIALFTALYLAPSYLKFSFAKEKHIFLSVIIALYFFLQGFEINKKNIFTALDFWWIALILFSGLSSLWSVNDGIGVFPSFHYLLLYLVFKAFETISWEGTRTRNIITYLALTISVLILLYQLIFIYQSGILEENPNYIHNELHFVPCLLSIVILPYFLFTRASISKFLAPLLLVTNLATAYLLGMTQAFVVVLLLIFIYVLFKLKYVRRIKYLVLMGFICIIGFSLYYSSKLPTQYVNYKSHNPTVLKNNVYKQDLKRSTELIKTSPIIGHGSGSLRIISRYSTIGHDIYFFPNNSVLAILCEMGLIGLAIYCYLGLFPILRLFNERNLLSRLELAAVVSLTLFFFLSLFYGEAYSRPKYFSNLTFVAVMGLAFISKKANRNTLISSTEHVAPKLVLLGLAVSCVVYFLAYFSIHF